MPLDLVRIDDRLVHGQVVIAWGAFLNTTKIILCHDQIARSKNEKEMYKYAEELALNPLEICVLTQQETLTAIQEEKLSRERIILLIETPKDLLNLVEAGLKITRANIGGLHFREGKKRLTSYIYVDTEDINCLQQLHHRGIVLEGKDVPSAKTFDISKVIFSLPLATN